MELQHVSWNILQNLTLSNIGVVKLLSVRYYIGMAEDIKNLSKYDIELNKEVTNLMSIEKIKFPAVLPALVDKLPEPNTPEFLKVLKKEHMKYRRSSFSMEEVSNILNKFGWEIIYTNNGKPIVLSDYVVKIKGVSPRIRFTDFMIICELFNIQMKWRKKCDRGVIKDKA